MAKCAICQKKVGVLGFSCACSDELVFCAVHRLKESHACPTMNVRDKVVLEKVVADKIKYRL
jgi:predicted nucleic acid binding AN1-type Zn finger protein